MPTSSATLSSTGCDRVEDHVGLVHAIARRLIHERRLPAGHTEFADLVADGEVGLFQATRRFDAGRGLQFSTYASHRIRGAMLDGLRRQHHYPRPREGQPFIRLVPLRDARRVPDHRRDPEEWLARRYLHRALVSALLELPDRERRMVDACFFRGLTLEEAGAELGISKSWACRIIGSALTILRGQLDTEHF